LCLPISKSGLASIWWTIPSTEDPPMNASVPHYLLLSETGKASEPGYWRFVLRSADGTARLAAEDIEPAVRGERLELLAVVRGLEALDQPSRVTLITPSVYVRKGIEYGVPEWRANGWRWEFFGEMVPIKDSDLWQRLERAMQYHQLKCRTVRFDRPHPIARPIHSSPVLREECPATTPERRQRPQSGAPWLVMAIRRCIRELGELGRSRFARRRAAFAPCFWVE